MTGASVPGPDRSAREALRQALLAEYGVLDDAHPSRPELRALVALAAAACDVPMATLNLFTEGDQHQVETVGFVGGVTPRSDSMCTVVLDDSEPVVLADARDDERFSDNPWVTSPAGVRFYATFPLRTPSEVPVGSLCVFDDTPRELDARQRETLDLLAARVVDVLELELQRRRLEAVNHRLVLANERLDAFGAALSHDLRGPLTSLRLTLELAGESYDDRGLAGSDPAAALVAHARRTVGRMAETVDHLMTSPGAVAGGSVGVPPATDWRAELASAVEDLGPELDEVTLDVAPGSDAAVPLLCHPAALRLALQNLLANAARYAAPHDPVVEVRCTAGPHEAEIAVVDRGPGVADGARERIFGRGERGHAGAVAGTGIGLATSRRLLEAQGGRLDLRATPGGGATFAITLPRA